LAGGPNPSGLVTNTAGTGGLTGQQLQAQAYQLQLQAGHQHTAELHQLLIQSAIALAIMAVVSIGLGWIVAGRALRPIRIMTGAARHISEDNLHERLSVRGPRDELKDLGDTVDGLLARLEAAFDSQRRFIANASHELRTPLTLTRTLLQMTLAEPNATIDSLRATCSEVLAAGEQQEQLIDALLTLARSQRGLEHRERVDLAVIANHALVEYRPEAVRRRVTIDAAIGRAVVSGDRHLLERMVSNLVSNALGHNVPDGRVELSVGATDGQPTFRIANTGLAIAEDEVERLLQPFQRLNRGRTGDHGGLGLGLSIIAAIANAHGAALRLQPGTNGGLDIAVTFPMTATARHTPRAELSPSPDRLSIA
jgi:signal transduction histidine kinase